MSLELASLLAYALLILMKIVCFILGYLIIQLGYNLIASGVKGEFKFSAELKGVKADLVSVSPGLLFVVLGVFIIGYAIHVERKVKSGQEIAEERLSIAPPKKSLLPGKKDDEDKVKESVTNETK